MSKFALLCQAARLLGQVISHVSGGEVGQPDFAERESQLDRTISAMIKASQDMISPDYDQIAFGYWHVLTMAYGVHVD